MTVPAGQELAVEDRGRHNYAASSMIDSSTDIGDVGRRTLPWPVFACVDRVTWPRHRSDGTPFLCRPGAGHVAI
ncbi:MAG TPA: hypothetical protein VFW69_23085 [Mycobacterium sp.]|nr:hypothetical protein [Mycobacterium sp.]